MDVNSTSTYVNKASSSNGFSGLASGVDTESMVEQMLASTQAKIDKQNGLKQQVEWKQEIYRDLITQINSFQSQFFGLTSNTNLMSQNFFNAMSAITSSNAFKVTASSSAIAGNTNIEVRQLATNTTLTSGAGVSGKLAGTLDAKMLDELVQAQLGDESDYKVKFEVGGKIVSADLRDVFVSADGKTFHSFSSAADRDAKIQKKLEEAFENTGVEVAVKDGALTLNSDSAGKSIVVAAGSGELGLQRLGLAAGAQSVQDKDGKFTSLSGKIDEKPTITFSVTLDDLKKDIKIDLRDVMDSTGQINTADFSAQLQKGLDKAHGKDQVKADFTGDSFELKVSAGRKVEISGEENVLAAMGVKNGQSNRINMGSSLKDLYWGNQLNGDSFKFTINGEQFSFTEDHTISDIIAAINRSDAGVRLVYRAQDDTFVMEASETGAGRQITMSQQEGNLLEAMFGRGTQDSTGNWIAEEAVLKEGQNALVKIDGLLTERSGNNFSVNGINITLTGTTGSYVKGQPIGVNEDGVALFPPEGTYIDKDGYIIDSVTKQRITDAAGNEMRYPSWLLHDADGNEVSGAIGMDSEGYLLDADGNRIFHGTADKIEVSRSTDQVVDGIKQFIDGYNKLIKTLNDYISEDPSYRDYAPLTEAQKKEMSEKEIELWEEKAKQGLLRNDSIIQNFLQSMRTALYEKPAGSGYAIYDLGIETGTWESRGQLVLSADGEAKLRQALESNPSDVLKLFTDQEEGLAVKLNKIIDETAKLSSGDPGRLVELAGVEGRATEKDNTLYDQLKKIDEKIAALKSTYEKEKARYWNQFNAMEQMIANMNTQSSWLTQMLG